MRRLSLLPLLASTVVACTSTVTPENPYDPATPIDRQAKASVSGHLDAPGLLSLAGIQVYLRRDGKPVASFSTDNAGAFAFNQLQPGSYQVEPAPVGFSAIAVPCTLGPGEALDVGILSLTPLLGADAATIGGQATLGAYALSVQSAVSQAAAIAPDSGGILIEAVGYAYTSVTASTGEFRLSVPPGTYTLRFSHQDYIAATVQDVTVTRAQTVIIAAVVLATNPGAISGHVVAEQPDGTTAALADATVTLDGTSATGLTNATGDFQLDQLAPGSYLLRVLKAGYGTVTVPVLNLGGGEQRVLSDTVSLALERGGLRGTVVLADSPSDASGVVVEVTGSGRAVVTGSDGAFSFDALVAGTYEVRARRDGYGLQVVGGQVVTAGGVRDLLPITMVRQGGTVAISQGSVTAQRAVTLQLGAPSAAAFKASEDPTFTDATLGDTTGTHPYGGPGSTAPFTLSDRDGNHDVYVVFVDAASNVSAPTSASIVLDRLAPAAPSVVIGTGTAFTQASTVPLALSAQDLPPTAGAAVSGLWKMDIANTSDFSGAVRLDYNLSTTWTLTPGEGVKSVYARFIDRAGNVSAPAVALATVDTTAPAGPTIALSDPGAPAGFTGSPVVTATLAATDANGGPGGRDLQVRLSNASGFAGAVWQAYASSVSWFVTPGDGAKTVYAQFMDPAGNQSLPTQSTITLAATAPSAGSLIVAGGVPATNQQVVPVALQATGASQMRLFVNGVAATGWIPYATSTAVDLGATPDEATRLVSVSFRNAAGVEGGAASASVDFDQKAPITPSVAVNGGAAFVGATGVTLGLSASDGPSSGAVASGLATVEVSNDAAFATSTTTPYATALSWTLSAGADGARTVYARFRDRAGNLSAVVSAAVTLDRVGPTAPTLSLAGNAGAQAGYTGTPVVTATLSATDVNEGAAKANLQVRLSNDSGFAGATWQPYATTLSWSLPGGDGLKTVYAQFQDAVGNLSLVANASITLAVTPPSSGVLVVEGGATATNKSTLAAVVSATGATQMRFLVDGVAVAAGWVAYAASGSVPLGAAADETSHTISVSFRNAGGVEGGGTSVSILLDKQPPLAPTAALNGGAAFTAGTGVTLTLSAGDGPTVGSAASGLATVEVSNDVAFAASTTYPYTTSLSWTLAAGADGARTVYARFRDKAGNLSASTSASTVLDTAGPTSPTISLTGNASAQAGYTGASVVTATLSATDVNEGAGKANLQLRLSNDSGFAGASWQPYTTSLPWVLPLGDGSKTVYVQFRDAAGNTSLAANATIQLLATAPSGGTIAVAGGAPATNQQTVTATLGAAGASRMQLYVNGVAQPGGFIAYATSTPVDLGLAPDETSRTVSVVFRNAGGVDGGDALTTIVMDRTAPVSPTVAINGGATWAGSTAVSLAVSAQDGPQTGTVASGLASVEVANNVAFAGSSTLPYATTVPWTLAAGADGARTVYVRFRDKAGNASAPASAGTTLDTAGPTGPTIALAGNPEASAGYTGTAVVTATLFATDTNEGSGKANLQVRVANDVGFSGASWQPYTTSLQWVLTSGDGTKTVYAQFRDAVGNPSATASNTIQLLTTPPTGGTILLAGGAEATSNQVVPVALSASNAATMRLSVNGTPVTGWIAYATSTSVDVGALPDQATRVVSVSFRNLGGVEGGAATASIRLDKTPPNPGGLAIIGTLGNGTTSGALTATPAVVLQITPPGSDETQMAVAQAASTAVLCSTAFATPAWQPVSLSSTLVLTGSDGAKRACVLFRDAAGNFATANARGADITLDTTPPTNPTFINLTSATQNAPAAPAAGVPTITASSDATAGGLVYQCTGGTGTHYGNNWVDCGSATTLPFAYALNLNGQSTLGVRARDAAYNYSPGTFVQIIHDNVAPFPPFITDIRSSRDSVTVTWDATGDVDVVDYLVYYGSSAGSLTGTGAAQGPSPVSMGAVKGQATQSFMLTGLTPGFPYYVAIEAVDAAGNRSGPGGERLAVPNRANPRVLTTFAGQPRTMGFATAGARTFVYLAENQSIVQLDVTVDGGVPVVVGRAHLPDVIPDQREGLAVMSCNKGAVAGHCVIPAGRTPEGDYRNDWDNYRAAAPIVFFKTTGTGAAPVVGTIEGILPVRPTHVSIGSDGGQTVIVTTDRRGVRVFTFKSGQLAFLKQVGSADFPAAVQSVYTAAIVGGAVQAFARVDPRDESAPVLFQFSFANVVTTGVVGVSRRGVFLDEGAVPIGDIRSPGFSVQNFLPVFINGTFLSWVSRLSDQTVLAAYDPSACNGTSCALWDIITLPSGGGSDGVHPVAAAGGFNQNVYLFVSSGLGGAAGFQVLDDGGFTWLSTFSWGLQSDGLAAVAGLNHLGQERLVELELSGLNLSMERYTVSGSTVTHLANAFQELPPEHFVEADRFLYVSAGASIRVVEAANPFTPTVVQGYTRASGTYTKLATHGRFLYALNSVWGVDIFRMNGDGTLTLRATAHPATVTDFAVVGRWLFVASSAGLTAYNAASVASGVLGGAITTAALTTATALDARTRGSVAGALGVPAVPTAMVYAGTAAGEVRTFSFNETAGTWSALLSTATMPTGPVTGVTVRGDYGVVGTDNGAYRVIVNGGSVSLLATPALLPISGQALLQMGYATGLAPVGDPSGPNFTGQGAGAVDGASRFSACAAPGSGTAGTIASVDGLYAASCQRNGITFFTPASMEGGRLLKTYDVASTWGSGAALASDGMNARMAGPTIGGDASRLYYVYEEFTAEGTASQPYWPGTQLQTNDPTGVAGADTLRHAELMAEADGVVYVVTSRLGGTPTVDAFDPGYYTSAWTYLGRYTFASTATPVAVQTDGEYLYVARNSTLTSAGQVDVVDIRNPAIMTLRASTGALPAGYGIASLALSRDRLYAGLAQGAAELNDIRVWDVSPVQLSGTVTARVTVSPGNEGGITGLAVVGRTLFYTLYDPVYQVPQFAVGVLQLGTVDRDGGAGATTALSQLPLTSPAQSPVVAGDVLYVASNLGLATFDLTPWWRDGSALAAAGGVNLSDPFRLGAPVTMRIDGPFATLVGGVYRVFDLR